MPVRLQKFLADAGIASRRASERIILDGRVAVNGRTITELGAKVEPGSDQVSVDSRLVQAKRKLYIALHKPPGFLCSRARSEGSRIISDLLPREWGNLFSVGRLDVESEGLILMTNDGDFCLKLTHPRYGVEKVYNAHVEGRVEPPLIAKFVKGIVQDGDRLKIVRGRVISASNSQSHLELILAEGKNREIRRLLQFFGLTILHLKRVRIGKIKLGELPVGKWRALTEPEIKSLLTGL